MATAYVATTPTRSGSPASINTPPTPRLGGFGDHWEPYSPAPRKSARLSSQHTTTTHNRTPSPHSSGRTSRSSHIHHTSSQAPTTSNAAERQSRQSDSMSSPPPTSPQKRRQPPSASRSVSGSLTAESICNAAAALGHPSKMEAQLSRAALALPTPAKTPAHRHSKQSEKDVTAVARSLFSKQQHQEQQQQQSSPKKARAKRTNDISLDSFEIHDDGAPIEIFTDSENRLPEVDDSTDNPFYGEAGIAASTVAVRRSSRNKKNAAVEKEIVEENLKREDGMLYVFRGKRVFRRFTEGEASSRPAVKPRLLFPPTKGSKENELIPEEEAETDIEEEQPASAAEPDQVETPVETVEEKVNTPRAPKFAPASPPATSRATRSKRIIADEPTPIKGKGKRAGGRSPFDGWQRTKNSPSTSSQGQKRAGEPLSNDAAAKRTKV